MCNEKNRLSPAEVQAIYKARSSLPQGYDSVALRQDKIQETSKDLRDYYRCTIYFCLDEYKITIVRLLVKIIITYELIRWQTCLLTIYNRF